MTIGRGEEQIGSKKLARRVLLLTPIDVITRQVGFSVDGPGEIDLEWGIWFRDENGCDQALRNGGREGVARSHNRGERVAGANGARISRDNGANAVGLGFAEVASPVPT